MILSHPVCLAHDMGAGHPESPHRLQAVLEALAAPDFAAVPRREAPRAERAQLERAHTPRHVAAMHAAVPDHGLHRIDADTAMGPASLEAALRAAGAVCAGIDAVYAGEARRAFCAVRPPGHHATRAEAMGFCLFNSVAVGAMHAIARHGARRVAIVDFDVHHGNGTQDIVWSDARLFYASSHQMPLYPGTGEPAERGAADNVVNAPLPPGAGSAALRAAYESIVLPALDWFRPELVLVSAGFDAHRLDPLANLDLTAADFGWLTEALIRIAERHAGGRLVSSLEGGYSLTALRESVTAHCRALFGTA